MAWVESHQSLRDHRKTLAAAALLKIDRYKLIGHLQALWWWALDNLPPDGSLEGLPDSVVDQAAGWSRKASFCAALRAAGFIDERGLHNWDSYGGKLKLQRDANKERMRETRAKNVQRTTAARVSPEKSREEKSTQEETREEKKQQLGRIFRLYENLCGSVNPTTAERLHELEAEHPEECLEHCFEEAALSNVRNLKYVTAILERHAREGCSSENGAPPTDYKVPHTAQERADFDEQDRRIALGLTPDLSVPFEEAVARKGAS